MNDKMISRMILNDGWGFSKKGNDNGVIKFKYYGEFEKLSVIYDDCKNELMYIGNSNFDGAPIFEYTYNGIDKKILKDFKSLNVFLRNIKIRFYKKDEISLIEKSMFTFLKFFMLSCENYEIKAPVSHELIKKLKFED